jgi:hypothetical protein
MYASCLKACPPLAGLSASGGFIRPWRVYPPLAGLSAPGGLVRLWRACPPPAGLSAPGGLVRLWRACPPPADSRAFSRRGRKSFFCAVYVGDFVRSHRDNSCGRGVIRVDDGGGSRSPVRSCNPPSGSALPGNGVPGSVDQWVNPYGSGRKAGRDRESRRGLRVG